MAREELGDMSIHLDVSSPDGPTGRLCRWATNLTLSQVPLDVQIRAKLLFLDGIGCGLIGAHLPWSKIAANAIFDLEPPGNCSVIGWNKSLSGPAATLLNSSFIQGFELDDWHPHSPLHSAALLVPALLAAIEHTRHSDQHHISGESLLLSMIVGLEVGPRIGLGAGGAELLSRGWHSGAVFGGPAVAVAVSKLLGLSPRQMEWAVGTSCTQAGGLMSAQYGSMTKRMQHGFAARNGFVATFLALAGYTGIEQVLECEYGGFFSTFSADTKDIGKGSMFDSLGIEWEIYSILIKPYPLMAALHAPVDCAKLLQERHGPGIWDSDWIESIAIEVGEGVYKKGGWRAKSGSLDVTAAQMNISYAVALQLVDGEVIPASFVPEKLNRRVLHKLMGKTTCVHQADFDRSLKTRITVNLANDEQYTETVEMPRGVKPVLSDQEIIEKFHVSLNGLLDDRRKQNILSYTTTMENLSDPCALIGVLRGSVRSFM